MKEHWKLIEDYPNYEVSDMGRVRNTKTGRVLRPGRDKCGYRYVLLCKEGKSKIFRVHRLVANAFILNLENKPYINHINGDKTDNRLDNLEWCTQSENIKHAIRIGLKSKSDKLGKPKQRVRCIETSQEFESQSQTAKYFGVDQGSIHASIHKGCKVKRKYHFELIE